MGNQGLEIGRYYRNRIFIISQFPSLWDFPQVNNV